MSLVKSKDRPREPVSFKISEDIIVTSTGAVNIHVPLIVHVDFFPSSFKIEIFEKVIYIDPVIVDGKVPADYILITHSHPDHFSVTDIRKLLKNETVIICPETVYKKISGELEGYTIIKTKPGDKMDFENITVESIGAYNVRSGFLTPHSRSAMNVGYMIGNAYVKIYHTGDTDYTSEMKRLQNITLVLTPIDGGNLTMTTEKAAEFVNDLKPRYVIPMHYKIGTDEIEKFKSLVDSGIQVVVLDK